MAARPAMPPTAAPAMTPPETGSFPLLLDTSIDVGAIVDVWVEEVVVAVAREAKEATSTAKVLARGLADDNEEKVSFINFWLTLAIGLSCVATHTFVWPVGDQHQQSFLGIDTAKHLPVL